MGHDLAPAYSGILQNICLKFHHGRQGLNPTNRYLLAAKSMLMTIAQRVGWGGNARSTESRNLAEGTAVSCVPQGSELSPPPMTKPVGHVCLPLTTVFLL